MSSRPVYNWRRLISWVVMVLWGFLPAGSIAAEKESFQQSLQFALAKSDTSNSMTAMGVDGWLFLDKELRHLSSSKYWNENPSTEESTFDPLPAILDFKAQLDKAGVDLLLVPVPAKAAIYPDKLTAENPAPPLIPTDLAQTDREFYNLLEKKGVNVLDLTESFLKARNEGCPDLYCKTDTHWSPAGIQLAAKKIVERIKDFPWVASQPKVETQVLDAPLEIHGDLGATLTPPPAAETLMTRFIGVAGVEGIQPLPNYKESPVILLGDSHNLVFHSGGDMHAQAAGLSDLLTQEMGITPDVVAVMGSGATPARRNLARRKDNLAGRRLVIWCFTSRELTQGEGWAKVQVIKEPASSSPTPH